MEDDREETSHLLDEVEKLRAQVKALQASQTQRDVCRPADEGYLREMAEHIREVFWVLDWQQKKLVYVSPAFEDIWGRPVQDAYTSPDRWRDSLHADDREIARACFAQVMESKTEHQWEYRVVRPDGSIRWVSEQVYAARDETGAVVRLMGVAEDITERKRSEDAVRAGEARLRAAVESLPFDFFMLGPDGRYVMQNSAATSHWGDCIGRRPEDMGLDRETLALWQDNNRRAMAGEVVEGEVVLGPHGRKGCYYNIITPIRVGDDIQGILGINIDITARRLAEEAQQRINDELEMRIKRRTVELEAEVEHRRQVEMELRTSEEKYRTLVESADETIAVVDRDGVFLFMNRTAANDLGGRPEQFIGKTMWDLFPRAVADRQAESVRTTIETGAGLNAIVLVELPGRQRWYNTTVAPIRDADGAPQAALIIARNIHEFREAQQQLEQYQQSMRQAERLASLGTLSATIAHELTQPLTVIRLSVQFAMAKLKEASCPPAVLDALTDSLDGVADVASRVERFRNYARQSTQTNPTHVRLADIVERTFILLKEKARARRVALVTEGLEALPTIHADPKDLEQTCFALIENAIQAADGKEKRQLLVKGQLEGRRILLSFEDTCGGIPTENIDKIFQPFFTTKPLGEGTGLGLCIVESTISRLGGKVKAESTPSVGSIFRVTLPLA